MTRVTGMPSAITTLRRKQMSYVNLPPEATFTRLERVLRNQKRLLFMNVSASVFFVGTVVASLASIL
jgi:hypothetical protein